MPQLHVIFVYGTLKRGFCRAHFLAGQTFLGEACTLPKYRMYNCGTYPGLKLSPIGGLSIAGELWEVDDRCLGRLDLEEGVHDLLYARQEIELADPPGPPERASRVEAYYYLPPVEGFPDCGECWV